MASSNRKSTSSSQVDPNLLSSPPRSQTIDVIEHRIDAGLDSIKPSKKNRTTQLSLQEWEQRSQRQPYHDYVHRLVGAGWDNLSDLDQYLRTAPVQEPGLIISVLDIGHGMEGLKKKRWPDMNSEVELKDFMSKKRGFDVKVRLYLAEYADRPATCVIEALGSGLKLDPRFFSSSIHSHGHVFTPSQRHRAPYTVLGFGVLDSSTPRKTDAEKFKVLIYIQPDEHGDGWTGVILFSSHTKINLSPRIVTDPPPFQSQLPPPKRLEPASFRELYIQSFEFIDLEQATKSPFYAVANVFRLNCFCWNQIITAIREEDHRTGGISDTTIGHAEEIKKSLSVVDRAGSLGWRGSDEQITKDTQHEMVEDFSHLVDQTELLWQTRDKMASIRATKSEARWNSLTNAFTYLFAPVTIITGVYGMNVSQISGSSTNPNIWQFFVAVAVFNAAVVVALAMWYWVSIQLRHGRSAGLKEVLGFAVGAQSMK
ncbi:hypothetical protein D0Z07_2142 [Hyphodiscus hymeniophilus]|uniref:Uncharacterized protein n=1 Tax=Hyphodiscus hymeniophilus TaxID=353542 RepID=A0A9P7B015_9HELO|nr:hypothetical protein D0Z07_2142 [Hyphodiscus hymeniophilus]